MIIFMVKCYYKLNIRIDCIMSEGEYIEYYSSGFVRSKRNYLGGEKHGESILYFPSGEISYKINYILGTIHGELIRYSEGGYIWYKSYYIDGKFVSELEWFCYVRNIKFGLLGL